MKTRFRSDADDWKPDGAKITDPAALEAIRHCLESEGSIIVEHWFYRGSRAPDRVVFNEFEEFEEYLSSFACAGDDFHVWSFSRACRNDNELANGKCPDDDGLVPRGGPY